MEKEKGPIVKTWLSFTVSIIVAVVAGMMAIFFPQTLTMGGGITMLALIAMLALIWNIASLFTLITRAFLKNKGRPDSEAIMLGQLYRLLSVIVIILTVAYGFGKLNTFGALFSMFGGMLLGWSLQAPVSGFAAWLLINIRRPFRPGDRIQFPGIGLTGDVKEIGAMYVVLDQVGGTVGSEEAVGRYILVPSAMLFSQVVINFTVRQEAAYMLDEVVVRITYNSDMQKAESILLNAAQKITGDIIKATGIQPYIRSDMYDYGLYLRLRYQTHVQDRPRIAYEINKEIVNEIQRTPAVDLAIPFIYSYRAGVADMDRKEDNAASNNDEPQQVRQVEISKIRDTAQNADPRDVAQLRRSIAVAGLLHPVILQSGPGKDTYEIVAGQLRFAACKGLGWGTIPAIVRYGSKRNGFDSLPAQEPETAPKSLLGEDLTDGQKHSSTAV
ncbi:MAG: ParB N-terminal domain-containing protein [bacterium]